MQLACLNKAVNFPCCLSRCQRRVNYRNHPHALMAVCTPGHPDFLDPDGNDLAEFEAYFVFSASPHASPLGPLRQRRTTRMFSIWIARASDSALESPKFRRSRLRALTAASTRGSLIHAKRANPSQTVPERFSKGSRL